MAETDINLTKWTELKPTIPHYLLIPQDTILLPEYQKGSKITDIFPINSVGIVTSRDDFVIDNDKSVLKQRILDFRNSEFSDNEIKERFHLKDNEGWKITEARKVITQDENWEKALIQCLYRPFDTKFLYYHKAVVERSRPEVMRNMLPEKNFGLISARSNKSSEMNHFFCARYVTETKCGESTTQSCLFPLYLYPAEGEMKLGEGRHPNLNPEFIKAFSAKLGLKFIEDGKGDLENTFGPADIFNYAYAVFHSPEYRSRYAEFLKIDFPRLPLTSNKALFKSLAEKGATLVSLHLMESPLLGTKITKYEIKGEHPIDKISYDEKTHRVSINKTQYFDGVPSEVWNFQVGGYQVCEKWLKDRKGRKLTLDNIDHYQKIVVALKETIRLMGEIDEVIDAHGGWPGAFK